MTRLVHPDVTFQAVKEMNDQHRAQVISYLKASRLPIALLLNFARPSLEHKRVVRSDAL